MTLPFPIARYLTPESQILVPEGFTAVDDSILRGLPHFIQLTGELRLVIMISTGVIKHWMDADPLLVVSKSEAQIAPKLAGETADYGSVELPSARIVLQEGTKSIASAGLTLGKITTLPETGSAVRVQVCITGWDLRAGSMRGPGNFGSRISLAWRPANSAIVHFSTPPVNPVLVKRLPPLHRIESRLGLIKAIRLRRFDMKRTFIK
ncbi:MAG: hypothetical protein KIT71_11980 [Nitrospira sp.]|nr:hypothetical protein [Nitrospira sp.]MCW5780197.1 hypothetical protein [Nitrospira sp.]